MGVLNLGDVPQEVRQKVFDMMRSKLPVDISDDVIRDIMTTNFQIVKDYLANKNVNPST